MIIKIDLRLFISIILSLHVLSCTNVESNISEKKPDSQDSLKLHYLFASADRLRFENSDSSLIVYERIKSLCIQRNYYSELMDYYIAMMKFYVFFRNDKVTAKNFVSNAQRLVANHHPGLKYKSDYALGFYYLTEKKFDSATKYYIRSKELNKSLTDSLFLLKTDVDLAEIAINQGNYKTAKLFYEPYLRYLEKHKDSVRLFGAYINMFTYTRSDNPALATVFLKKAQVLLQNSKTDIRKSIVLFNLASLSEGWHKNDSALYYASESLKLLEKKQNAMLEQMNYLILCRVFCSTKEYGKAYEVLAKVKPAALNLASELSYYEHLVEIERSRGNYSAALRASDSLNRLQAFAYRQDKSDQLLNHETLLKKLSVEKAMKDKNQTIRVQKNTGIFLLSLCFLLLIVVLLTVQNTRKSRKLEQVKLTAMKRELQLKNELDQKEAQQRERNRISQEMHDDFGANLTSITMALNMIKECDKNQKYFEIIEQSSNELASKMNEIVWSLNQHNDNLLSLVAYIRSFAVQFLSEARIRLNFTAEGIDDTVMVEGITRRKIYLIVRELLNNIVKHANATEVNVNFIFANGALILSVKDNGIGVAVSRRQTDRNGLKNIEKQVIDMQGKIKWEYTEGTKVDIAILLF